MHLSVTSAVLFGALASASPRAAQPFRFLGRVNPATKELTWTSTGVAFTFTGSSAVIPFTSVTGANAIEMIVDGGAPIVIDNVNTSSISTPAGLANGNHTVELRKKSEALYGSIFVGTPTTTGKFGTISTPRKRIEIIGDSISVGYGVEGKFPCTESAALENGAKTYGALTAKNLSMDYSIVAWSGKGLIRNYVTATPDGQPIMPEYWTRYGANDADNSYDYSYNPDIVVINLGTNDFGYILTNSSGQPYNARSPINGTDFTAAMVKFVKTIQAKYTKAEFFITSSPMLSDGYPSAADAQHTTQSNAIIAAVKEIGSKAHFVNFPPQDQSTLGCDYHPSPSTHEQMAAILTSAIQSVSRKC